MACSVMARLDGAAFASALSRVHGQAREARDAARAFYVREPVGVVVDGQRLDTLYYSWKSGRPSSISRSRPGAASIR